MPTVKKIRGIPFQGFGSDQTSGNIFYVDSGDASAADAGNAGTDLEYPLATIDYAIGLCTANNGDTIYVLPGHDENPTTSITMDVAGVRIVGLGWGASRPTVTFGALAVGVVMSAASCSIENIRFDLGTVAATVTNCFNITGGSCRVHNCETVPHATSQFTNFLTATDAQFVVITNNLFRGLHSASGTSGIVVDGCDDIIIQGNIVMGHFTEHALDNTTPGSCDEILRAYIADNVFKNDSTTAGDLAVELDGSATGVFARNMLSGGLATTAANYDIGNLSSLESYIVDDAGVDVHGIVLGTAAV
jgi:hypothetical protein